MVAKRVLLLMSMLMMIGMSFSSLSVSAHTSSEGGCEHCEHSRSTSHKLKDPQLRNAIMQKIQSVYKSRDGIYKKAYFKWNEAVQNVYGKGMSTIAIPLKANAQSSTVKTYVNVAYNANIEEFGHFSIMHLEKANADTDAFTMTVSTLQGVEAAGVYIDENGKASPYLINDSDDSSGTVHTAGYWQDVQDCIQDSWKTMPAWTKWVCGAACGGCIFANPYACGGCLGCLGGYALGCMGKNIG